MGELPKKKTLKKTAACQARKGKRAADMGKPENPFDAAPEM